MPQKTVLDNGLRVVTEEMPQMQSVTMGIFVATGSRYEAASLNGISHFLEHMFFKGSAKRPDQLQIARAIEGVGGHLNGYTHQEATAFYAVTLAEHFPLAMDVLADMVLNPTMQADKLATERGVVIQEIRTMKDVPQSWVHELLHEEMWKQQPLGRPIAGTEEIVGALDRDRCLAHMQDWYHSKNSVVSVAGRMKHEQAVELSGQFFSDLATGKRVEYERASDEQSDLQLVHEQRECEEVHLCLGLRGYARQHPDEYVVRVIDTIMGSGMSSRLFQEMREKRGLAYSVGAYPRFFQDTGAWVVYASVATEKTGEAIRGLVEQLELIKQERIGETELSEAKQFIKGSMLLSLESTSSYAMMLGERELLTGKLITPEEIGRRIDAVTADDVQRVASNVIKRKTATLAVVGPVEAEACASLCEGVAI